MNQRIAVPKTYSDQELINLYQNYAEQETDPELQKFWRTGVQRLQGVQRPFPKGYDVVRKRIMALREEYDQQPLGELLGVSRQSISVIERGMRCSQKLINRIASRLNELEGEKREAA